MLSRVADRLYWMARYLERAENTARLINVHNALLLDLPADADMDWQPLLDILGCKEAAFRESANGYDTTAVQRFLVRDESNTSSLFSSLRGARENARTTRDLLPTEAWRAVNELQLYVQEHTSRTTSKRGQEQLVEIVKRCQTITGLLAGTMSQGAAYQFIRIGRNLERADMTTRLIDVAAALLLDRGKDLARYDNTLWMAVLRSLSGYQMYRQHVRRRISGPDVIMYILADQDFPRSVSHCLQEVAASLESLPHPEQPQAALNSVTDLLDRIDSDALGPAEIHELVDRLQIEFGRIHETIHSTWLNPKANAL